MQLKRMPSVLKLRCMLGVVCFSVTGTMAWMLVAELGESSDGSSVGPSDQAVLPAATPQTTDAAIEESDQSSVCDDLLSGTSGSRRLVAQLKQLHLRAFSESLRKVGYSRLQLQLVGDLADARLPPLDPLPSEYGFAFPAGYSLPEPEYAALSLEDRRRVSDVLEAPRSDLLVRELAVDRTILQGAWRDDPFDPATTVLGQLIRSRGPDLHRFLDAVRDVVAFGLHELAVAIERGVSGRDFVKLLEHTDIDPGTAWADRRIRRDNTLALVAALNLEPEVLSLLLQRGSDPSLGRRSVLDELPLERPWDHERTDNLEQVVRILLQTGDRPYLPSTLSAIEHWLSDLKEIALHPDAEFELATTEVVGPAQELRSLVGEWNRKVEEAVWVAENCLVPEAGEAVSIHGHRSLAAKTRQQEQLDEYRSSRIAENAQAMRLRMQQFEPGVARLFDDVIEALAEGRWNEAIALVDESGLAELHGSLLSTALSWGAESGVIEALIERNGGTLPPNAILMLASSQGEEAVAVANELRERRGLDLHFVNEYGMNAVSEATLQFWDTQLNSLVVDEKAARWLEYLASNSVTMKPSEIGLDPLDTVLLEMLRRPFANRPGVRVARFLIDHGAPIELSHRELVEHIAQTDFDGFRRLVKEVPELLERET